MPSQGRLVDLSLNNPTSSALCSLCLTSCSQPDVRWWRKPDGTFGNFTEEEGFSQGCPLSPLFAALVPSILLKEINPDLLARTSARPADHSHPGDDNRGSLSQTTSHVDDTKALLPHRDLSWFLSRFAELGKPLGIFLDLRKTQMLTSATSASPIFDHNASPEDASCLCTALAVLGPNYEFFQKEGSARDVRLESSAGRAGKGIVVLQCRRRSRLTDVVSCAMRSQLTSRVD